MDCTLFLSSHNSQTIFHVQFTALSESFCHFSVVRDSSLGENCSAQQYVSEMMPDSKQTQLSLHISTPENRGDSAR